ncbi:MAG: GHKL domain-containing protein [Cyclobacteriaceae bacterium]
MIFNKQFFHVLLRVLLLVLMTLGMAYSYYQTDLTITPIMFGVLIILIVIELVYRLQKQERIWSNFLLSVKYQDFNRSYHNNTSSKELVEAYDLITRSMEEIQLGKEAEFKLFQTVLAHISIAVACYQEDGEVIFTNPAFDELLDLSGIINIDALQKDHPEIYQVMLDHETPSEWVDLADGQKLFVKTESLKLKGKSLKLISLTDIRNPLDAKEVESYQKLMRVMTHEIMNSTTPILSLIRVINKKMIIGNELNTLNASDQQNVAISLNAIETRAADLLKFVEAYKEINRSINPMLESVASTHFTDLVSSLKSTYPTVKFTISDELQDNLVLDRALMSQVISNLVKNSAEAVQHCEKPEVTIRLLMEEYDVLIQVMDNGSGVSPGAKHQIFIPFYTTKKNGSGIGLSLSRNIVRAHGGQLEYSRENDRSYFTVRIPALEHN